MMGATAVGDLGLDRPADRLGGGVEKGSWAG